MGTNPRLLRITTVPISLHYLLSGQFTFFQQQGFEVLTASAEGTETSYLKELNIHHKVVPMTRTITPLRDVYCLWQLIKIMLAFEPLIVHTHTPKAGLLGMLASWICQVPIRIHTIAGLPMIEAHGIKRFILKLVERITYSCAHKICPNSKGLFDFMVKEFNIQSQSKFKVIGRGSSNGIDTQHFLRTKELEQKAKTIRIQHGIKEHDMVFCFVGRMVKDKGLSELVSAFQKVSETQSCHLLLVGSFEEELDPLPMETMRFLMTDGRVILAGFQNDVRPWMMASDVFVFPSYREGFPNVVMQAACLEVPIIVSDINGCNELIEHGKTGLIVPLKNSESLKEAMLEFALDKKKACIMASAAHSFVSTNYSRDYIWQELLKEYQLLLNQIKH